MRTLISICLICMAFAFAFCQPVASEIFITSVDCAGQFVQFVAGNPLMLRDTSETQYYVMYRAQFAPFCWEDLHILTGFSDSDYMINPIEDFALHSDSIGYRWMSGAFTEDNFMDTNWYRTEIWGSMRTGICSDEANWFYICAAVDTTPTFSISPQPSRPVGEYDQMIYPNLNYISYAVDIGVRTADSLAMTIPGCTAILEWDIELQTWTQLTRKVAGTWIGRGHVEPGRAYQVHSTSTDIWSITGAVPADDSIHPYGELFYPSRLGSVAYVAVPYQRYNAILSNTGIFPFSAKYLAEDMDTICMDVDLVEIDKHNPLTQTWSRIADRFDNWASSTLVYPGQVFKVVIMNTGTNLDEQPESNINIKLTPNPFRSALGISYYVNHSANVSIEIFDISGRRVHAVEEHAHQSGQKYATWKPANSTPEGIYLVRISIGEICKTAKVIYFK